MKTWDAGCGMRGARNAVKGVALALSLAVLSAAWAQKPADPPKPTIIKPGKMYEKCMTVTSAQKLEYEFQATKPVDFNIHFHRGDAVMYPVKRNKTTGEADRFSPTNPREDYCLMWENKSPSAEVELTYRYKVVN